MNVNKVFSYILFLSILFQVAGCVGTIEEATPPQSLENKNPPTTFSFPGITTARAIAHDKIELEFFPASGGTEIVYKLYINNSTNPISIDPQSLTKLTGGKLLYTVKNLATDREYKFKVQANNVKTAAKSADENEAYARTFDNIVADFGGITKVSLVPGDTDNSILVDWIAPTMTGVFTASSYDPVHYEVTVISEIGGSANLNNPMYFGSDKRVTLVPSPPAKATPMSNPSSTIVDGLIPGLRYYVQVRAIHSLYQAYTEDPTVTTIPINREVNNKYLSIKTDNSGSLFDFQQENVVLSNASGIDAFDKIDVFWQPGSGSFTGYRIFLRKYDGTGDASVDDKLTEATLGSMTTSGDYFSISPALTSKRISGLENNTYYQVKVALCKITSCPVLATDPNAAIISELKSIKVQATLAPFTGINSIQPPGQYSEKDVVQLKFDAPLLSAGYANALEFYCVNPLDHSQMILFDGNNPITGSGISSCDNLYLAGTPPPLSSYTSQKVKGLVTDGTREYCFASTPSITGYGSDIRLSPAARIVRCSYPEVFPPSVSQFPGLKNTCTVTGVSAEVSWNLPTGGIYSGFQVFWKEKTSASKFSFPEAVSGTSGYSSSSDLTAETTSFTATGLIPGRTYQVGVLAKVDMDAPTSDLYSEYNLQIIDCSVPLPIATFKGFTRIFAVGPKTDGRYPNSLGTKTLSTSSYLYEAVNAEGIPYEVAMDNPLSPNLTLNYALPPGRDAGANFSGAFDGLGDSSLGYAMSKEGIVSLAWEEASMSFPEADSIFVANQPTPPALRSGRRWGYKVYRSSDNKLTWQDLTLTNGLIYTTPYSYSNRTNSPATSVRMGFFTDYSVRALTETHDAASGKDIERARIYFYKIVPVFDGKLLEYSSSGTHIVKVTLPPPNMALVHRWMSNRAHCLEYDKIPNLADNYTCPYNGIGSIPKDIPYRVGDTVIDQQGDLLIDRNELGCRYTRGDRVSMPEVGASSFDLPDGARRNSNDQNFYPLFRGYRTISEAEDTSTPYKGCVGQHSRSHGATGTAADYPASFTPDYYNFLQGDCIGNHNERIARTACSPAQYAAGEFESYDLITPGSNSWSATMEDCSLSDPSNPTTMETKHMGIWAANIVMQSEFLAVFYNTYTSSLTGGHYIPPVEGPSTSSLSDSRSVSRNWGNGNASSQCMINLAAIDGSGFMKPRWISVNDLGAKNIRFKNQYPDMVNLTVNEITEVLPSTVEPLSLYNGTEGDGSAASFKLPNSSLRNSSRYRGTTRIGKIFSSNASKLPPIGRLNPQVADAFCSTYFVQTGIATDSGNFAPDMQPVSKRTLRRAETISASAWPDSYNSATVATLEASNTFGSCKNTNNQVSGTNISKGERLINRMSVNGTINAIPLVSGSSPYNGLAANTENESSHKCISRFGIQDIVGNLSEANSERIFCDYSQDSIFMGPVTGTWSGGNGAINQGAGGPEFPFFNNNDERDRWAVLKNGNPSDGSNPNFELRFRDGSPTRTDIAPWVRISVDSGYCSTVDSNPIKRTGPVDYFKDVGTGYWTSFYLPGGALNTSIIERSQKDQESVLTWRNGDGRFLDFGPQSLAAPFNKANTLALSGTTALSKYFNPVIGLPLACSSGSCNDPQLLGVNDNTFLTTEDLNLNVNPDSAINDIPTITNFPVGNSEITHAGISDFQYSSSGYNTMVVPTNNYANTAIDSILQALIVDDPVTMGNPVRVVKNFPEDFNPGETVEYYRVVWDIARGTEFTILSGGKSNTQMTGRYTASIVPSSWLASGTADFTSGTRCAVLINQDP